MKYDAIIIGSGLGGLTTAVLLAKSGKRVLVLERHYVAGGFTHTFKRRGFEWDVGVHYVGQMSNPRSLMRRLFDYVTEGRIVWTSMGAVYDTAIIGGDRYDFVAGVDNQIAQCIGYFPEEETAIRRYFRLIKRQGVASGMFFGERAMPPLLSRTVGYFLRRTYAKNLRHTTYEVLSKLTKNQKLIGYLCAQCGDYGLAPKQSGFGTHAALVEHYLEGASYPSGGAGKIHETLTSILKRLGGELILRAEVKEVILEKQKAIGVRLANGKEFYASRIISNAGARNSFTRLLPAGARLPATLKAELAAVKPSSAHVCLYVGLDRSDKALQLPKMNYWIHDSYDFDASLTSSAADAAPPFVYISFPSAKDPEWAASHPDKATIQVLARCPYEWVKRWEGTAWGKRGPDYLAFKNAFTEHLLAKLYEVVPQVKGHVVHKELSTPLSTRHFGSHQEGEIYGLEHTPARFRLKWLRVHTPIERLYLTGQDVTMVGVGGALFSGLLTASAVLHRNLLWRIFWNRPLTQNSRRQNLVALFTRAKVPSLATSGR